MDDYSTKYILALTGVSAVSDFSIKAYAKGQNDWGFVVGAAGYLTIAGLLKNIVGLEGVAYVNNMWNAGTSLLETAIGLYQGESLSNKNLAGAALIIIGAYLVRDGRK